MAFRELSVVEITEILRRWSRGDSLRTVSAGTGADRKTVRRYIEAAKSHGFTRGAVVDDQLLALVVGEVLPGAPVSFGVMRELCRKQKTLIEGWVEEGCKSPKVVRLLHRHTGVEVPERTMRRFIREELSEAKRRGATVRIVDPPPGQVLEIDFMEVGRVRFQDEEQKLYALVCVAAYSRHMFVWPCMSMSRSDLMEGLEAAWTYFGGIFPVVVADNPKAIVSKADPIAPVFNEEFAEYAQHRGFVLDMARVRRPQDKPRVERAVQYVRNDGFGGERLLDLEHARRHIARWCSEAAGRRVHGTTRRRPVEAFTEDEQDALLPVPTEPYDTPKWVKLKVGRDQVVSVAAALYSVPHHLRGEQLHVRLDRSTVKMYHRGIVVKVHPREPLGGSRIDPEDLPPGVAALATRNSESLQVRANAYGEAVGEYVKELLGGDLPWTRMRHVYRLLGLCQRFEGHRVDAACRKALDVEVVNVMRIQRMLERDLVHTPIPEPPTPRAKVLRPRFGRDPGEYRVSTHGESNE